MAKSGARGGFKNRKKASNNGIGQKSQTPVFGKKGFTFNKPHDAKHLEVYDIQYYASKDFIRDVVRMNNAVMKNVRKGIDPEDFVDLDVFSNRHDIRVRTKDDSLSILQNARLVQREALRILKNQPDISWRALAGDNEDKKDFKRAMSRFWGSTEYRLFGTKAHPTGGAMNNLTSSTGGGVPIIDPSFRTSKSFKQAYNRFAKHAVLIHGRLKDPNDPKSQYDVYDTFEEALGEANRKKGIRAQLAILKSKLQLQTISHDREPWPTSDDSKVAHKMHGSSILKAYAYGAPTNPINVRFDGEKITGYKNPYEPETVSDAQEMFGDGFYNVDYNTAVYGPTPLPIFQSRSTPLPNTPSPTPTPTPAPAPAPDTPTPSPTPTTPTSLPTGPNQLLRHTTFFNNPYTVDVDKNGAWVNPSTALSKLDMDFIRQHNLSVRSALTSMYENGLYKQKNKNLRVRVLNPTASDIAKGYTGGQRVQYSQNGANGWSRWTDMDPSTKGFKGYVTESEQHPERWIAGQGAFISSVTPQSPQPKPLQPKPSQIVLGTGANQFPIDKDDRGIWSVNQNTPQNLLDVARKRVAAHNAVVGKAQGLVASGDPQYAQSFFTQRGNTQIRINSPTEAAIAMGYTGHSIWARRRDKDGNWRDWEEVPYSQGGRYHSLVKNKEQYGENWFGSQEEMEEFFTKHPPEQKKDLSKIAKALTSLVSPVIGLAKSSATLAGEMGGAYASATGAALTENIFNTGGEGLTGALGSAGGGAGGFISGIGDSISGGGGALGGIAGNMSDGAKGKGAMAVAGAALAIGGQVTSAAGSAISGGWDTAVGFLKSINKAVIKIMNTSPVFEAIKNILSLAYQMAFLPAMTLLQTNLLPLFTNLLNWAVGFGQDFAVTFQKYIEPITGSFRSALSGVMEFFNSRKNDIAELLAGAIQMLPTMLEIQRAMIELIVNNKDAILETVNLTLQAMKSLVSQGVIDTLLDFARSSAEFIDEYGESLIHTMVNIAKILQKLTGGVFDLSNSNKTKVNGLGGIGSALVGGFRTIFGFAEGGYVPATPGGVPAIIGEGGEGEYIIPESKMSRIGGGVTINFTGNVYGMNDFKYQVRSIMNEYSTKSNYR